MKKIILFIVITLTLMLIPKAYAASTVEEISNINIPPLLSEKKYVYINNMDNYTIKINDNANFEVLDKGNSYIVTQNIPTSNKIYNNPFEVSWDKIGYYVDDNGKPVYLDAKVKVNKIILKWTDDISDSNYRYYSVGQVGSFGLELLGRGYDNDFKNYNANMGIHDYFTITLYNDDGSELNSDLANSLYLQWSISDLDMGDRTVTKNRRIYENDGVPTEFSESIKFDSGFDNKFYVINDSVLKITENNTKYIATESTSNDSDVEKSIDFSTVVAYQTGASAEAEWWGCECGTTIVAVSNQYPYPTINEPIKSVEGDIYKVGEKVEYTINETFPYTDSHSKAKSIELSDSFDKALNISGLTYQVFDADNKDVTSEWKKTVSGQTVTLKYTGEDTTTVYGKFTFKFSDLRVLDPDSSHEVKKENGVEYKIIPNKAKITIVGANDDTSEKETNIVKIKVGEITNPQTGMKITMIIGIIMTIVIGSISIYYFTNKKKIYLK